MHASFFTGKKQERNMPLKVEAMPVLVMRFLLTASALVVSLQLVPAAAVTGDSNTAPRPDCPSKCGDMEIPYPFGIGENCSWPGMGDFTITCNDSFNPPRPYTGNIEVISISVETGEMRVFTAVSYICYNSTDTVESAQDTTWWSLVPPFLISPTKNIFTAIGCDTLAFLDGGASRNYLTGCFTYCPSLNASALDGEPCYGLGCCQTSILGNLGEMRVTWNTGETYANNSAWEYSPCNYAFVGDKDGYNFSRRDLNGKGNESFLNRVGDRRAPPLVLDWAIRGNGSCQMAEKASGVGVKLTAPACASAHSDCVDVDARQGGGYLCKCSKGYMGNPYIPDGCTNINECSGTRNGPCGMYSTCEDTDGDYNCKCKFNRKGDGKSQTGCYQYIFPPYAIAAVATIVAVVLAWLAIILFIRRMHRKRFHKNGGDILKGLDIIIFTEAELRTITKNYSKRIGGGFFGDVFMGTQTINGAQAQEVAVKRTVEKKLARDRQKMLRQEAPQHEQEEFWKDGFVKEITFQFRIRHPNVVRLIGCCLETEVPKLVFEFVRKGSLHDVLHGGGDKPCALSLPKRLDIAIGSAEALAHMHSHGECKHVHGDVKPGNILLDDELKPKVSDFGSSKLLSVSTYAKDVAADGAYTDTVYYKTGRFTVKSDVYSFGVVLLELITRKTAKYDGDKSLPLDFVKCCRDERSGRTMYDRDIFSGDDAHQSENYMECLDRIGALAVRCLKEDVDERPTMAEVVEELKEVNKVLACGGSCSEAS